MSATDQTSSWPQCAKVACVAALQAWLYAVLPIMAGARPAQAQPPIVTDAEVARAAKSQPVITGQDIEQAARRNRMPTDADLARVPVPAAPRVDALPQPLTQRRIDLGAVAKGYEAMGQHAPSAATIHDAPALLVFVSFSMPDGTLARLVDQAARARATLVLRGLVDGSLQKTVMRAQGLIGQRKVAFQIDPQAFDRFSITVTPTFVLLKAGVPGTPCAAGTCFPESSFLSTAGDVSMDYALEHFRRSAPAFRPAASAFLARLRMPT